MFVSIYLYLGSLGSKCGYNYTIRLYGRDFPLALCQENDLQENMWCLILRIDVSSFRVVPVIQFTRVFGVPGPGMFIFATVHFWIFHYLQACF